MAELDDVDQEEQDCLGQVTSRVGRDGRVGSEMSSSVQKPVEVDLD